MDFIQGIEFVEEKRTVDWALRNNKDWEMICGVSKDRLTEKEFDRLAKRLLEDNLFQVYYVLFYRYAIQNDISVFPKGLIPQNPNSPT